MFPTNDTKFQPRHESRSYCICHETAVWYSTTMCVLLGIIGRVGAPSATRAVACACGGVGWGWARCSFVASDERVEFWLVRDLKQLGRRVLSADSLLLDADRLDDDVGHLLHARLDVLKGVTAQEAISVLACRSMVQLPRKTDRALTRSSIQAVWTMSSPRS